jgi:hypothetical protein
MPLEGVSVSSCARVAAVDELSIADLPQVGSSPAIDLQRRLGEAALRGFYDAAPTPPGVRRKNYLVAGALALVAWGLVFGVGVVVIG